MRVWGRLALDQGKKGLLFVIQVGHQQLSVTYSTSLPTLFFQRERSNMPIYIYISISFFPEFFSPPFGFIENELKWELLEVHKYVGAHFFYKKNK